MHSYETMIVGSGPAGAGALTAFSERSDSARLIADGLAVVDENAMPGAGNLLNYNVRSDSAAGVFVQCVRPFIDTPTVRASSALATIQSLPAGESVALTVAGALLQDGVHELLESVTRRGAHVYRGTSLTGVQPIKSGGALVSLTRGDETTVCQVENLILAVGGKPWIPDRVSRRVAPDRLVHSDAVLRPAGLAALLARIGTSTATGTSTAPRIVIVGRAHSAFSVADRLLSSDASAAWPEGTVTIATRGAVRVTYETWGEAIADGAQISSDDVCPKTGRVFRLCGLRGDSAARYRSARDGVDTRLVVRQLDDEGLDALLATADFVISATGYTSRSLEYFPAGAVAHPDGTISATDGMEYVGIRTIGLGSGTMRFESSGGERSYNGPVDGVWHYQAVVAPPLLDQLFDEREEFDALEELSA